MSYRCNYYGHRDPMSLRSRYVITLVIACMLSGLAGSIQVVNAQVIHIPADQPTIQSGIDVATDGDTVLIAEGTYFENINFRGKAITIASQYYIDGDTSHIGRTIINGSRAINADTASVVTMWSGEDTTSILAGLTITGGRGTYIRNVHSMEAYKNRCYYSGGGILIYNSGGKIIHNIIEQNHVSSVDSVNGPLGCGIFAAVNDFHSCIIRNNVIEHNSGTGKQGWGAGISIHGGSFLVERNNIHGNTLSVNGIAAGAGIFYESENKEGTIEEIIIRNNIIKGNRGNSIYSMGLGGGIAFGLRLKQGRVQVYNNIFAENYVEGFGGGIYSFDTDAMVYRNFLLNNSASLFGDAISLDDLSEIKVDRNTICSGKIWILSPLGLKDIIPGEVSISDFSNKSEIIIEPFTNLFGLDPASGKMYIGCGNGLIPIKPELSSFNVFTPPVIIVHFSPQDLSVQTTATSNALSGLPNKSKLRLPNDENSLYFKFDILDNYGTSRNQFKYYMKGVDADTIFSGREQHVQYGSMKTGSYTFWVSRSVENGNWEQGISLKIRIYPPWYRSYLAIGIYAIVFLALTSLIIRSQVKKYRIEKIILENRLAKQTLEINEKNQRIIEMEQLKTKFFTDISHEIRTPLSLITGPLENLMQKGVNGARENEWLGLIKRNSERLSMLVSQLLDISRLDAGYMKLVLEENDLIKHLKMLVSEYSSLAERKNIQYIMEIPDRQLNVYYDKEKMERITSNLLSNAFKFTPEGGIITCRIKIYKSEPDGPDNTVRIIIADTGPGIPLLDRDRVFDRFFKSEGDEYDNRGGAGIGLSLTKDLVSIMHGSVVVKSVQGSGTIFFATIQLGIDHLEEKEYIIKSQKKPDHKSGEELDPTHGLEEETITDLDTQIMVVEDHDELREFIRESLSDSYTILEAVDGNEALKLAFAAIPDLIISDIMMPGMDGMELCKILKSDERTSHIPVILLTAKSTEKDQIEGLEIGADAYMFKPFSIEILSARINNLLEQSDRLRKKYSNMIGMDWGQIPVTNLDEEFLKKVNGVIIENMKDFDFDVTALQEKLLLSRSHLFRKVKALTGESPGSLIRIMRLKTAASLIENGNDNITEISLNVGISNLSYFAKCFKDYYGKTPRDYKNSLSSGTPKASVE